MSFADIISDYERATLDKLTSSGSIAGYKFTEMGVEIQFNNGMLVEFSANSGPSDEAFLEINEA